MTKRTYTYDVVVIGGGLSGMMAAAGAEAKGARVALLTDGCGMLELTTGCVDLLGVTPDGQPVERPWEAFATLTEREPLHPYALLGAEGVRDGLNAFRRIMAEVGCTYQCPDEQRNQWIVTSLGHLKPTYLTPEGIAVPRRGQTVRVIGFKGLRDFHPGVFAEGLRRSLPDTPVTWEWVELPPHTLGGPAELNALQVARLMDEPEYREKVLRNLKPVTPAPDVVLFPAVLGVNRQAEVRSAFSQAVGAPVAEIPLMAPSLPGLRLARRLTRYLEDRRVDLFTAFRVTESEAADGRVTAVRGYGAGRETEFRAKAFVLATGGLLGQGLEVREKSLREPIFGLPVQAPEDGADHWASREMMPAGGHPFLRCGIRTDAHLRPSGWTNLHVCGRMLADYDPYTAFCGGGVAVATGWRAGQLAGGVVS